MSEAAFIIGTTSFSEGATQILSQLAQNVIQLYISGALTRGARIRFETHLWLWVFIFMQSYDKNKTPHPLCYFLKVFPMFKLQHFLHILLTVFSFSKCAMTQSEHSRGIKIALLLEKYFLNGTLRENIDSWSDYCL